MRPRAGNMNCCIGHGHHSSVFRVILLFLESALETVGPMKTTYHASLHIPKSIISFPNLVLLLWIQTFSNSQSPLSPTAAVPPPTGAGEMVPLWHLLTSNYSISHSRTLRLCCPFHPAKMYYSYFLWKSVPFPCHLAQVSPFIQTPLVKEHVFSFLDLSTIGSPL